MCWPIDIEYNKYKTFKYMNIQEASEFIAYNIKQGAYDPEEFKTMSDEELIKFAEQESDRAEASYYQNLKGE